MALNISHSEKMSFIPHPLCTNQYIKLLNLERHLNFIQQAFQNIGAWWLSGKFGALHPQCHNFEPHSSRQVSTLGKSSTHCLGVKFDSCNNLLSSIHTLLVNILWCVRLYILFGCWPFPLESPSTISSACASYHPVFLLSYHFLKFVSFLGANRSKSASVGPRLLRGAI